MPSSRFVVALSSIGQYPDPRKNEPIIVKDRAA